MLLAGLTRQAINSTRIGVRTMSAQASTSRIPVISTLKELREWRSQARDARKDVGVVPTMGALHQGHLDLVKRSLRDNPYTVMTLFVNPMQFAPTEDLSRYPRTLQRDLELLSTLLPTETRPETPLVVFAPSTDVMYPLKGELQDMSTHRGVSVEMRGWGEVMEGASRPQFFKGVATVCTKLFNAVEPDHAYFGQKDIQQALLLKIMLTDTLTSHPLPENLHILPTTRDPKTHLALSSRNAYLSPSQLAVSPVLYNALASARDTFRQHASGSSQRQLAGEDLITQATKVILAEQEKLRSDVSDVELRLDYIEVFDKTTFEPIRGPVDPKRELVIAGAVWVGTTRLIDNLLLGWDVE